MSFKSKQRETAERTKYAKKAKGRRLKRTILKIED